MKILNNCGCSEESLCQEAIDLFKNKKKRQSYSIHRIRALNSKIEGLTIWPIKTKNENNL